MRTRTRPMMSEIHSGTGRLVFESLENRTLLSADGMPNVAGLLSAAPYGDANLDGAFTSADLVQVFQAGKYQTEAAADWFSGDWTLDGRFDSQDLIAAFQQGAYSDGAAAAKTAVPFTGVLQAVETYDFQESTLTVNATGSGTATHLGRFTLTYQFQVDLLTLAGSGTAQFIAANGDRLFANVTGQATPTQDPDVLSVVESYTISGGTGRFADVTGSVTVERLLDTGVTSGTFSGIILK